MSACDPCVWTCCQTRTRPAGCRPWPTSVEVLPHGREILPVLLIAVCRRHHFLRSVFQLLMRAAPRGDGFASELELGTEPDTTCSGRASHQRSSCARARPREPAGGRTVFSFTAISIEPRLFAARRLVSSDCRSGPLRSWRSSRRFWPLRFSAAHAVVVRLILGALVVMPALEAILSRQLVEVVGESQGLGNRIGSRVSALIVLREWTASTMAKAL